nr:thyroid receptor-interacting protein 6 isoform X1 [Anolis sagrei ordinatus]XP_060635839.1 thyroid receptor-interacting protein 6 isoform X1 [Anolis sagrei ordinatus]
MSGPTWLPPKQVGIPGQPDITASAPATCRPQKSFVSVPVVPKPYGFQEANGTMNAAGLSPRYQPPVPGPPPPLLRDSSPEHHYSPADERGSGGSWAGVSHSAYALQQGAPSLDQGPPHSTSIDLQIDSLTSMLADMEGIRPQRRGERPNLDPSPYSPALPQSGIAKPVPVYKPGLSGTFPPAKPSAFVATDSAFAKSGPNYSAVQSYPAASPLPGDSYGYHRATGMPRPFPQPIPASYTTTSSATGPPVNVQVKVAQPVLGYHQPRRRPELAYGPPSPRPSYGVRPPPQYASEPGVRARPLEAGEPWYPEPPSYGRRVAEGELYPKGGPPQPGVGPFLAGMGKPVKEDAAVAPQMPTSGGGMRYQHQAPPSRPEEELDRLTKKLVYDMNHPPSGEYFGRCSRCGENVVGDGTGCVAMDQVFHVECFTCATCRCRLRGQPFYAIDRRSYCESCYIVTLEKCSMCSKPIMDRILRAMGKTYHPQCFTCVVCHRCLDGVPFTVDATSQIHCIEDFHRKFAPRCSVCGNAIMPEPGQEETVRIVALDRSFHIGCYKCEECGLLLSSEGEGRGCYPLDGHILCKSCSAQRIQELSSKITTDC